MLRTQQLLLTEASPWLTYTVCRSMAESYAPSDWKKALSGRQFERSGMQAYGAAKLFNIMLAKEYSKRLKVCQTWVPLMFVLGSGQYRVLCNLGRTWSCL